jgi:hypothetical protein
MVCRMKLLICGGVLVLLTGLSAGCQSTPPLADPSMPGISVGITNGLCPVVIVEVGQQVTWTNQDSRAHIVRHKSTQGDSQFSSGTLQPGDSFAFGFLERGSFVYECSLDGEITGTVTVQ